MPIFSWWLFAPLKSFPIVCIHVPCVGVCVCVEISGRWWLYMYRFFIETYRCCCSSSSIRVFQSSMMFYILYLRFTLAQQLYNIFSISISFSIRILCGISLSLSISRFRLASNRPFFLSCIHSFHTRATNTFFSLLSLLRHYYLYICVCIVWTVARVYRT